MTESPIQETQIQASRARLQRLEGFLLEDNANQFLLVDAFEAALRCGEFERAEFHLRHGLALQVDTWAWRLKEGDWLLAQNRFDDARGALQALQEEPGLPAELSAVLIHNLAYVELHTAEYVSCVERLAPLMESHNTAEERDGVLWAALQTLWLRALHRTGELARAIEWMRAAEAEGTLNPRAAGVGSLIAMDADDLLASARWSRFALEQGSAEDRPLEALNAQAALALGENDPGMARRLSQAALQIQPKDGRTWSTLAFADMLAGELDAALVHFDKALHEMPEHVGTWHGLAWTQLLMRRLEDAKATFNRALDMDRNFAESHGGLAVVLALGQQNDKAQPHIERALRLDRNCLSAQYAQAIINGEAADKERFQRLAQRLLGHRSPPT